MMIALQDACMNPYVYLAGAIVAEVLGTTALEYADGFSNLLPTLGVFLAYGTSFYILSQILDQLPIGPVYATWAAAGIVLVAIVGTVFLGQQLDLAGVAGIVPSSVGSTSSTSFLTSPLPDAVANH